jgi:hypothetical protein
MNPNGNHPFFPTLPDGKRDIDHSWDLKDTWKQMEAMVKKGWFIVPHFFTTSFNGYLQRQSSHHRRV